MILTFNEALHEYRLGGQVVPSVTQLLAGLYAEQFSGIPPDVLAAKAQLGTYVHLACELDDKGTLIEETLDPRIAPYLAAWRKFKAEKKPQILLNEQRMADTAMRFAGTVDRLALIDRIKWVIDLKGSVSIYPQVGIQLAAYQHLIKTNYPEHQVMRRAALQLKPDGTYKFGSFDSPQDWPAFRGLLAVHQWRESNGK